MRGCPNVELTPPVPTHRWPWLRRRLLRLRLGPHKLAEY